jgi:hypothetical protein
MGSVQVGSCWRFLSLTGVLKVAGIIGIIGFGEGAWNYTLKTGRHSILERHTGNAFTHLVVVVVSS